MRRSIVHEVVYRYPSELIGIWLMPNDFEPHVGHRFTFRTKPGPGFDDIVRCKVVKVRFELGVGRHFGAIVAQ